MNDVVELAAFNPSKRVAIPGDLVVLAQQYLTDLQIRNYSEHTVRAYTNDLEQFVGFAHQMDITLAQHVTGQTLDDFTAGLISGNGVNPRTAARRLETVRALFKFAIKRRILNRNPVEDATPVKFVPAKIIAPDEDVLMDMINAIPDDTVFGIRDRAMFYLMY
ncbi:MAG: site-specific integrase, partial [Gammaproteobacteria bacterium]|nr:site-specific integrase [Gammaproteobacteria bacterium]